MPVIEGMMLPSDSSLREDSNLIFQQEWERAEAAKHALEEVQRNDKKLRERAAAARADSAQ